MGGLFAPGTVGLPALISGMASTTLPTLGAGGLVSITLVIVVGVVVGVSLLLVWLLPFSSVCRVIEAVPSTPRSPWTGWRTLDLCGGTSCLNWCRVDHRGRHRGIVIWHYPRLVDHGGINSWSSTLLPLFHFNHFIFPTELLQESLDTRWS